MAGRSSCPECGTILRIRDRSFVGRRFNCPECKTPLRIQPANRDGEFSFRRLNEDDLAAMPVVAAGQKTTADKTSRISNKSRINHVLNSPWTVAILLTIAVSVLLVVLTLRPRFRLSTGKPAPIREPDLPQVTTSPSSPDSISDPVVPQANVMREPPVSVVSAIAVLDDSQAVSALDAEPGDETISPIITSQTGGPAEPPPPPKVDVPGKMAQKLVSYKQPKVTRRDLLEALEEQLGAPIRYDKDNLGIPALDEKVAFELENTTVGDVIKFVADKAGWEMTVEVNGIRLQKPKD